MPHLEPVRIAFDSAPGAHALGAVRFGAPLTAPSSDAPHLDVPLHNASSTEVWSSDLPVQYAAARDIRYAHNGLALFAAASRPLRGEASFEHDIECLYNDVLALTKAAGYPHVLRMWNYFPGIHTEHHGLDRYQRFCIGRQRAFAALGVQREQDYPAATVIGTHSGAIAIYFLAARTPGESLENPRQVSAYRYPAQYGPVSPAFSRGVLKRWNGATHFYISGTASIVGHETQHEQILDAQLDEILRNLNALAALASTTHGVHCSLNSAALLKVYVRNPDDVAAVRAHLLAALPNARTIIGIGDICRRNLLVEIEATLTDTGMPHD